LKSIYDTDNTLHSFNQIISWVTNLKSKYELSVEKVPLKNVKKWIFSNREIYHESHKYFTVLGIRATIENREVVAWDQPMIKPAQEGLIAFIIKPINGILHFLVQAKLEVGNFDVIEFAPTVQCLTGNYRKDFNEYSVPFIEEVLSASKDKVIYSSLQSEEGGRFYYEQNKNVLVLEGAEFNPELPENYCWMSLGQILNFLQFNNYFNIAARSLISAISPLDLN
jgi:oxidase EvaA